MVPRAVRVTQQTCATELNTGATYAMWASAIVVERGGATRRVRRAGVDETQIRQSLEREDLKVLSIRRESAWLVRRAPGVQQIEIFCSSVASLLDAGLPILQAIDVHREASGDGEVERQVVQSLRRGQTVSDALAQAGTFDPLLVAMVRANERSSSLATALRQYAQYHEASVRFRRRVAGALIYPIILVMAGLAVTAFLGTFVVPRFADTLRGSGHTVPGASAILFVASDWLSTHWVSCLVVVVSVLAIVVAYSRRIGRATLMHRVASAIPGVRTLVHDAAVARLMFSLGTLLRGGLPLVSALGLSGPVLPPDYRLRVNRVTDDLRSGGRLSAAFNAHGLDTPTSRRLLEAAERSGDLQAMLLQCARHEEQRIEHQIDRFLKVAEPLLLALIGLVVGTVVVLLYLPIFELVQWTQ